MRLDTLFVDAGAFAFTVSVLFVDVVAVAATVAVVSFGVATTVGVAHGGSYGSGCGFVFGGLHKTASNN